MRNDSHQFLERYIRSRAVAPLDPSSPGLFPEDRRSWWEFCLGMNEFLGGVVRGRLVSKEQAQQLSRLRWILIRGSHVFATSDPALRGEQRRYVELCVIVAALFAVIVDADREGILDGLDEAFGPDRLWSNGDPKWPAQAEALVENWLPRGKNWEHARSPVLWIKTCARRIHARDQTHGGRIRESDAMYRTPEKKRDQGYASLAFDYRETARELVPLEEVAQFSGVLEVALKPRYTWMSVASLEAEIRDDEDLRAYARLRHEGWKQSAAAERLGWTPNYGKAVDRRYRRFLAKVRASGFEYQAREIDMATGLSEASCTVVKERLRIPVHPTAGGTLSGRVVYEPRTSGSEAK